MPVACGDDDDASFHANATWGQHVAFTTLIVREVSVNVAVDPQAKVQPDWVLLDNQVDIIIVHPRFLRELQSCNEVRVNGIGGLSMTVTEMGHLDDCFQVHSSNKVMVNMYLPGEGYMVHLHDRDIIFSRIGKLYIT